MEQRGGNRSEWREGGVAARGGSRAKARRLCCRTGRTVVRAATIFIAVLRSCRLRGPEKLEAVRCSVGPRLAKGGHECLTR